MKNNKAMTFEPFLCPYCFEPIEQDKVCFLTRPNTEYQYSETEIYFLDEEAQEKIRNRQKEGEPYLSRKEDAKLDLFWRDIGGTESYTSSTRYFGEGITWNSPLVTPEKAVEMTEHGYEKDEDGFVCAVTDKFNHYRSEVRICPHCHNPLPEKYGKYPIHMISVVGITSSGKTVYLHQLISEIDNYLSEIGISKYAQSVTAGLYDKISSTRTILPIATAAQNLMDPISIVIKVQERFETLVFFDIGGHNCADPKLMDKYGAFVKNSDGIIVLIDPNQFPPIAARNNVNSPLDISTVLSTMKESFLIDSLNEENKVEKPFAFVVSKSDYLVNDLLNNPRWRNSLIMKPVVTHKGKVNWGDMLKVRKDVKQILHEYAPESYLVNSIERDFNNYTFLAISSIGCDSKWVFANMGSIMGTYSIGTDDLEKSKLILINMSNEEERLLRSYIYSYQLLPKGKTRYFSYTEGKGFSFNLGSLSREEYETHKCIQFRLDIKSDGSIATVYEQFPNENDYWMDGVQFALREVPSSVPQPRRVEEPLHWMMYKLGLAEIEKN